MAASLTPAKRPSSSVEDETLGEAEAPSKSQKTAPSAAGKQRLVTYKVLCPVPQSGSVIGKGGSVVSRIRQDTRAKIKLEDAVLGCNERIVIISSHYNEAPPPAEKEKEENEMPAAFDALMRIFERVMLEESDLEEEEGEGGKKERKKRARIASSSSVNFRMLVLSSQVGSLVGKNGVVIKRIMADSGAQVRVLSRDVLPICAKPQEDAVQIAGELDSVRKAVVMIAKQLLQNPPNHDRDASKSTQTHSALLKQFGTSHVQFGGYSYEPVAEQMAFYMLCTNDQVGSVIGKAGYIVKNIKNETDCDVMISEIGSETECEDRLITVKGPVLHGDIFSPVQHAVLRVQHRLALSCESKEQRCRMVIGTNQVGCLLGQGGSVMAKMRKRSGASIRIVDRDDDQDRVVIEINGNVEAIQEALVQITSKLKNHFLKNKAPPFQIEPPILFDPYMGRNRAPFHQHFPTQAPPPFHNYGQAYEEGHLYDVHAPWGPPPPAMREPLPDYAPDRPRRASKYSPREEGSPVIPNITLEVTIPRSLVPNLCGEVGGCLNQIREISEAKITITELRPELPDTVFMVSGVPEHAYCARSLLEAFVISELPAPPDAGIEVVSVQKAEFASSQ